MGGKSAGSHDSIQTSNLLTSVREILSLWTLHILKQSVKYVWKA